MDTNNNVGKNEPLGRVCDDVHFDLAPTAGTDAVGARTGQAYDPAALLAIAIANGATYDDGTPFAATDEVTNIEVDLKPVNGEGYDEGGDVISTATTSDASYVNNGSRTDLDPSGGREDADGLQTIPTSVDAVWVCNGSILTVHLRVCKDATAAK